jgi:hypothetical protein
MAISSDIQNPDPQANGAPGPNELATAPGETATGDDTGPRQTRSPESSGPKRPGLYALALLLIAGICAGVAIAGYNKLNSWRLTVSATASASGPATGTVLENLSLTGASGDPVHWTLLPAYARRLTVTGAGQGQALVQLPIPLSACPQLGMQLGVSCTRSGEVTLPSPVTFSWSTPALFSSGGVLTSLDVGAVRLQPGQTEVDITPTMAGYPSVCAGVAVPTMPSLLTVTSGPRTFQYPFSPTGPNLSCYGGVSIMVGRGGGAPPVLELGDVSGWKLTASHATGATLQGFTGQLALQPGTTTVTRGEDVKMRSAGTTALAITVNRGSANLSVHSKAAASVLTQAGELVPSFWTRETAITSPVLGGFVAVFVLGPLTAFMQLVTDRLKNWPGPSWPRRRRRAARTGADRARS